MASIENVILEIVENQGSAAALVKYRLSGSPQDVQQQRRYSEVIELVGVDEGAGEDGQNELIAGARFDGVAIFSSSTLDRNRLLAVPSSALDEDRRPSPLASLPLRDEIRARVTLTEIVAPISANSNVVHRGELVITPVIVP